MRYREPAICLRCVDYSETSQIVHFITRGCGVARLIAKGSKRSKSKSGGAIDLLSEGDLVFITSDRPALGTLVEFTETVSHAPLRNNARLLNISLYMIEMVGETLAEADPHPEVFDLLHNGLLRLCEADAPAGAVLAYFQWRLLRRIGLLGDMERCVSCGSQADREVYFASAEGGLLCGACEGSAVEKFRLTPATLSALATLAAAEAGKKVSLPQHQADAVNRMLAYHVTQQLGKELKLARYVLPRARKQRPTS